ncbi:unnamed protein product, partial [Rotaria sp. Silwood1]
KKEKEEIKLLLKYDTCTYGHNLFGLIHHTSVASHLFVCEGTHLDESGLVLVLLIKQFLPLPLNKQLLSKYLPLIL